MELDEAEGEGDRKRGKWTCRRLVEYGGGCDWLKEEAEFDEVGTEVII